MIKTVDCIIIGGGAAGFFTAINAAENAPNLSFAILERGKEVLTKVKISGGGRCNVTHAAFIPKELSKQYPRGEKELLGPFHTFMTGDTITWFEERGVALKIEDDGRMFPTTDTSQTIIDCFMNEVNRLGVEVFRNTSVKNITTISDGFCISTNNQNFNCKKVVVATGSNPKMWNVLERLEHTIVSPVPSLFTFNIKDPLLQNLQGLSTNVTVKVVDSSKKVLLDSNGPLLITHWGVSGPAILKLSAWGARLLAKTKYRFLIKVNWLEFQTEEEAKASLLELKAKHPNQTLYKYAQFNLPKRLWQRLLQASGIEETQIWARLTKKQMHSIALQLTNTSLQVEGKSTFKEEFVTAGGVDLKEINFKTFESKIVPNLYLAGEVLNIDAITGGFNFQNAWTGAYIVAKAITENAN